ncbi:MAG: succinylglutamate desuccinylase/aspartoacylase family protein [Rhodocyclaceae bacterium]|nr:succinylglutamate desuccinylase/aspartoacylase family protein [Rhodocyclaceae bacterium]MCA3026454.1 succinylglutamate desuccinylase/aspartoacylase family protein [Rhodocyclaceae bacterium]MCA3029098.1 succinylglutamate desuccinylase/aspartoacylase family protein [Rhodocyclaceae bacterium]MCA3033185.1 succinylglutamate desuccinylase/aspartoacylase family protein [Rhodocyclaceae bacterium]MCA3038801.1 succinylglutamate desuccinylase/aspartoacylase family protein [Rhodocyclaceae bacterium]
MHFQSTQLSGIFPGPRLIVTGAVHGNETCGTIAIKRVLADIDAGRVNIVAGHVTFVPITNPLAYQKGDRVGDRNLNRNLYPVDEPVEFEDHVANWLCPLLAEHDALLDLHSTRAKNPAFAMLGPVDNDGDLQPFKHHAKEREMAAHLGVHRFVDGWLDTYSLGVRHRQQRAQTTATPLNPHNMDSRYGVGTTEYMRSVGGYAITLECGQHDDPQSPEVGYRAILNTLALLGISDGQKPQPVTNVEHLHLQDVIDKHDAGDSFSREWASFDRLTKGDWIGTRQDGTKLVAPFDGYMMFPDAKSMPGNEWYYLARAD